VGEADERRVGVDRRIDRLGGETVGCTAVQEAQLPAGGLRQPRQHVAIRGELVGVGQDHPPVGLRGQRGRGQLVEVDGGAVTRHDLAGPRADQSADPVPHCGGQVDPAGPTANQVLGPGAHRRRQALRHGLGGATEGVAVEVDGPALDVHELAAVLRQRVGAVQRQGGGAVHQPILAPPVQPIRLEPRDRATRSARSPPARSIRPTGGG
jgi:hypothetical protein